jgi:hypothetical protein
MRVRGYEGRGYEGMKVRGYEGTRREGREGVTSGRFIKPQDSFTMNNPRCSFRNRGYHDHTDPTLMFETLRLRGSEGAKSNILPRRR